MPIALEWFVPDQVGYSCTKGILALAELDWWDQRAITLLDASPAERVHVVIDNTHLLEQPGLLHQIRMKAGRHPKVGWLIIIQPKNPVLIFVSSATAQFFKVRLRYVDTLAEALAFLQEAVEGLPDLTTVPLPDLHFYDSTLAEDAPSRP